MHVVEAERAPTEQRLREQLQILTETTRAFAEANADPSVMLDTVARRTAMALGAFCCVSILSDDRRWLKPVASFDSCGPRIETIRRLITVYPLEAEGPHPLARALQDGEAALLPALTESQLRTRYKNPVDQEEAIALAVQSLLFIPLQTRGKSIGGVSLIRYGNNTEPFDKADFEFAQNIADHAALAIANGMLFASVQQELGERKKAEAALSRTEEQLRQVQKLEAVGRLAGGVAHDFNNLLSVILGCCSFILEDKELPPTSREDLDQIRMAAERAADLTRQLLAFSRRQILEPRIVNLNEILMSMEKMMPRLVGEDVTVNTSYGERLGKVKVDPGHMEQVIMNLAVNARDAMPNGGTITTVETANVELDASYAADHVGAVPGPHVMLALSDTGNGMSAEIQAQIFEPFFTTKAVGKGTGLGLSTVFGIVKQSGGSIWVYSEVGQGTTFKIYFPRTDEVETARTPQLPLENLRGDETVLLVEDNQQVRLVASAILKRGGYRVLEAGSGSAALALSENYTERIDILLTDVVMPQMNGRELSQKLHESRPHLSVLYMSGYTEDAILHHHVLSPGIALVQKPLTPESLLRKLRQVLDARTMQNEP